MREMRRRQAGEQDASSNPVHQARPKPKFGALLDDDGLICDTTSCDKIILSALRLLPRQHVDTEKTTETRAACVADKLRREEITNAWQLRALDRADFAELGVSLGLRTAIERVLESGALISKTEPIENEPFSRRRASSSGWLWESQRDQMMTEKIQEEAPRVALLLKLAGLLPSNASLPVWYGFHRQFVSIVVFAFGPLVHSLYLQDSWLPEAQRAVHRLPYSSSVWALYIMLAVYSAGFRIAALKAMGDTGSFSRLARQVILSPKKKRQLHRDSGICFFLVAINVIGQWLAFVAGLIRRDTVSGWTPVLVVWYFICYPFWCLDNYSNFFMVRLFCIYNQSDIESTFAKIAELFGVSVANTSANGGKSIADANTGEGADARATAIDRVAAGVSTWPAKRGVLVLKLETGLRERIKLTRRRWAIISVLQLTIMLVFVLGLIVNRASRPELLWSYEWYYTILECTVVPLSLVLMVLLLYCLACVTDKADKEMAKLISAAGAGAGTTSPASDREALRQYVQRLKAHNLVAMHVLSQRWNAAALARLLLGLVATLLFMATSGWYRHLYVQ